MRNLDTKTKQRSIRLERNMQIYAKCISGSIVSVVYTLLLFTAKKKLSPWGMKETYGGSVRSAIKGTRRRGENRVKEAFKVHECE